MPARPHPLVGYTHIICQKCPMLAYVTSGKKGSLMSRTATQSLKDLKSRGRTGWVAIVSAFVLPAAGLLCLFMPHMIVDALPYILGVAMVMSALLWGTASLLDRKAGEDPRVGKALVLAVLGVFAMVQGLESIGFLGTAWGLLGLGKAGEEFDEAIAAIRAREPFFFSLAFNIVELVLALLLIVNPFENIEHHVIVLGIQLILYPFGLRREQGKTQIAVEV